MKQTRFKAWTIAVALVVTFSLAACGNGKNTSNAENSAPANTSETESSTETASAPANDQPVKLRIYAQYFDDDTKKPYDYAVAELKKSMPNVELVLDPSVQDNGQKLRTYAASGNMPDIFQVGYNDIKAFSTSKNIEMLDNAAPTAQFKQDLNPGNEPVLIAPDGHIYAYPYSGIEFQILFYNKKLFADAGVQVPIKTFDQWKDAIAKFKAKGIVPLSIFSKEKWIGNSFYKGLVTREEPNGYAALTGTELSDAFKLAAKQFNDLKVAGLFDLNATNTNYDQASSMFYTGKAAMFVNGQWEIYGADKQMGDNVDWMYWPAKDEATYDAMKFYMDGSGEPAGYGVSTTSKNKETAIEVAAFISRKYAEFKYTQLGNPIVSVKVDKPITATPPAMMQRLIDETLPNIKGFAKLNENVKISTAIDDNTQNLIVKDFSDQDFIKNMNRVLGEVNK
ncbi:ABC transporter substrate-binding protein [Cohnella terricola]|uniref:Extracellular solute-binding protein n=1 Tax=Cohnella terricola TaxID=1289167 RepID=A0A559J9T5_9BACL|nr:extracellular solute-binding protein [Cohnella terricola]TVX96650.1 extracellular solute-binding protein [Cohnella terricola]